MKLIYTTIFEIELKDLASHSLETPAVTTIQQAAELEEAWIKEGVVYIEDLVCNCVSTTTVQGVE